MQGSSIALPPTPYTLLILALRLEVTRTANQLENRQWPKACCMIRPRALDVQCLVGHDECLETRSVRNFFQEKDRTLPFCVTHTSTCANTHLLQDWDTAGGRLSIFSQECLLKVHQYGYPSKNMCWRKPQQRMDQTCT